MSVVTSIRIPDEVAKFINALPKKEKSRFISKALIKAIDRASRQEALEVLEGIKRISSSEGKSATELVDDYRKNRASVIHNTKNDG